MRNITVREVAGVLLWSCVVVTLTAIPYVLAERAAGPGRYFSGFLWGVDEGNVYLSWIRQTSEGAWFIENQYTTRFQKPHFFNIFLLILGRACRYLHLQPIQVFHLARLLGIPFALYAFYCLVAHVTALRLVRGFSLVFASLSSGFGWIATLLSYAGFRERVFPIDCGNGWQVMPEAVTFLSFLLNPLFTWSLGLMCLTLLWAWRALEKPGLSTAALAGLLLLLLGNVHSYDVFAAHGAILLWALFLLLRRRIAPAAALKTYLLIWIISLPAPLWAWYASHADPAYLAKVNTPTLSPRLLDYAAGYGLLGLAALLGALTAWVIRGVYPRSWAVVGWAAGTLALVYAPVSFQRKMIEGFHLALSYLAALALVLGVPWLVEKNWPRLMSANRRYLRRRRLIFALAGSFVLLTLPSNVFFVYDTMQHVLVNNADLRPVLMPPVYLTKDEVRALQWLGKHCTRDDVVLSSSLLGNYIPAWSRAKVVCGHWAETLNFSQVVTSVASFYAPGLLPQARQQLLDDFGATYVLWSQYERELQKALLPAAEKALAAAVPFPDPPGRTCDRLVVAFRSDDVTIYAVKP